MTTAIVRHLEAERYRAVTRGNVSRTPEWERLDGDLREAVDVISTVLPFRTNAYVMRELIDWNRVPDDPMYQLTFPQRGMLSERDYAAMRKLVRGEAPPDVIEREANRIRLALNPHPAGQLTHNVPSHHGKPLPGLQHKYKETVLFFPSQGQTCHAYCSYCFRWAQFVGLDELKFASNEIGALVSYLREHEEVSDVLITGGDPMVMSTRVLRGFIEGLLAPGLDHIQSIRIGTKSLAYWPHRFVTDRDAEDLLALLEEVADTGRQVAIMGHYSHPVELSTDIAREAVRRVRSTGANIRMQSPIVRQVNDDPDDWALLWRTGVRLGCIPYYMFVERDTGARNYFEIPLVRCWEIYRDAYARVSGLARTVRGPSMSTFGGKVHILGVKNIGNERLFVLEYLQARDPALVGRPFFARFDPKATWFDSLTPASACDEDFFIDRPGTTTATSFRPPVNELISQARAKSGSICTG